jgi:hypothetical protein
MSNLLLLAVLAAIPTMVGAQNTRTDQEKRSESVPSHMMPPAGKCRIWMVGVAPAQQPAPTDCQTALRQRPTNGVVVFGPMEREAGASAFRGRPTVEQGQEDRPRTPTTGQTTRETPRTPTPEPRRASPARPPSGTRRPTEDPAKKPPEVTPSSDKPAAVMSPERTS